MYTEEVLNKLSLFLDASKAIYRVNYWKLFDKLLTRDASVYFTGLLVYWQNALEFSVNRENSMSMKHSTVSIKEEGILYIMYTNQFVWTLAVMLLGIYMINASTRWAIWKTGKLLFLHRLWRL